MNECCCISRLRLLVDPYGNSVLYRKVVIFDPECPVHIEGRVVHLSGGAS